MIAGLFRYRVFTGYREKKPRGVLRKARLILKQAESFAFRREFNSDVWSDYGHEHLDWDGLGNFSPEVRLITLEAHAKVFRAYSQHCLNLGKPFQLFLSLPIEDGGQDAVYFHTPNPQSSFPAEFSDVEWGVPELEKQFSRFLPEFQFVAGRRDFNFIVWAKGVGVPLVAPTGA
jgi:hypothetical protein